MLDKSSSQYNRAVSAYLLEDFPLAQRLIERIIREFGEKPVYSLLLGNIHQAQGNTEKAVECYRQALEHNPGNPEAFNNIGVAYKKMGDFQKAYTAFVQANELAPDRADICYNLGNLYKQFDNFDNAEIWYRKSINIDPSYINAYNNLGTIFEKNKEMEKAEEIYKQGLSIDKNNATLHYNLGITYEERGRLEDAQSQYETSLKFKPGWTPSLNNLGSVLQNQGKIGEAEKRYSQLLKKNPEDVRAITGLGSIHAGKGDTEQAMKLFKKALTVDPSYKTATMHLKNAYMKEHSLQEALEELNRQTTYHPEDVEIQLQIGQLLSLLDRKKDAEQVYNRVLDRHPENLAAYKELAEVYARMERPDRVRSCVAEIQKRSPEDKDVLRRLAEAYLQTDRNDEAEHYINQYLEFFPEDDHALKTKATVLQRSSDQAGAAAIYSQIGDNPDFNSDPKMLADMAEAFFQSGDKESAVGKLERLVNLQGAHGNTEDIENLSDTLDLYEKTLASFEQGQGSQWHQNLEKIRQITMRDQTDSSREEDTVESTTSEIPIAEEDAISLLDISAMEPVIRINEEDEILFLEEETEDLTEQLIEEPENVEEASPSPEPQTAPAAPSEEGKDEEPSFYSPAAESPDGEALPSFSPNESSSLGKASFLSEESQHKTAQDMKRTSAAREGRPGSPDIASQNGEGRYALDIAGMINYLLELSHELPEEKKKILIEKSIPLKMASVIKKLSGGNRFKEKVSRYDRRNRGRNKEQISGEKIGASLSAFRQLTDEHPDNLISSAFKEKMDHLLDRLKPYL